MIDDDRIYIYYFPPHFMTSCKWNSQAGEMCQQGDLATKPDNLSLIPGFHPHGKNREPTYTYTLWCGGIGGYLYIDTNIQNPQMNT